MYNALKIFFRTTLIFVPAFLISNQIALAQSLLDDSLSLSFIHFHEKTIDNDFKKTVEKAQELFTNNKLNDSLICSLDNVERQLVNVIEENQLLNFRPFNRQIVFSFGKIVARLFQQLTPKNENLYYASALNNLGELYSSFGQSQKGNILIERAFLIRKKYLKEEHPDYAESLLNMARICSGKDNQEQAIDLAKKVLILTKKVGIKFQVNHANCLFFLADVYRATFQYDSAAKFFDEELSERKKILGGENAHYALYLYRTADMFQYLWQFDKSILYLNQALELTQKTLGDTSLQYAYCLDNLGGDYYSLAEYKKAVPFYVQSLSIKEKIFGKDYSDNSISLHNLATAYQQMGDYASAIPLAQRAAKISKKALVQGLELDFNYAFSLNYLASLYQSVGQYSEALSWLKSALIITKKSLGKPNSYYARTLNNLGILYENISRYDSALYYYMKVLKLRHKISAQTDPEYATSLDNLAGLYKKIGKYDIAIRLCRQGLEVRKTRFGDSSSAYAASLNNLGELYMKRRKYDTAFILLNQSLNIRKNILGTAHPDYVKSLNSLALLNITSGKTADAAVLLIEADNTEMENIRHTYTTLSEQEKIHLINGKGLQFNYLPSLLYKNPEMPGAVLQQVFKNEVMLKAMVLNDQKEVLESIRQKGDSVALQKYNQWYVNKVLLNKQLLLPLIQRLSYFDSLQEITDELEQQLSRISVAFREQQQIAVTVKIIAERLLQDEAAVEFMRFKLYNKNFTDSIIYAALLILPGDTVPKFVPLFEERQLSTLLPNSTAGILFSHTEELLKSLVPKRVALYNLIWKPLEKYLAGVSIVNYAPVGLLNCIPFGALPYNSLQTMVNKYRLNQFISLRSLVSGRQEISPKSIALWGNINYDRDKANKNGHPYKKGKSNIEQTDAVGSFNFYNADTKEVRGGSFNALPATKLEIDNIRSLFESKGMPVAELSDTSATEEAFKSFSGKSPQILHFATHGFCLKQNTNTYRNTTDGTAFSMQDNPMFRSGLVLAGGNNTWNHNEQQDGREDGILTAYEIAQMDLSNTDLVVLSACRTALGDLQGNEGVIGLQRAFKMAGVKQIIMSLWNVPDKETADLITLFYTNWINGQSIREAFRNAQLKIKFKYPSPYYWAAFVLVE